MDEHIENTGQVKYETNSYNKLFGQCFEIPQLTDNRVIPVGGSSLFSEETDIGFVGDFSNFNNFIRRTHDDISQYNTENLTLWLKNRDLDINPKLIATLEAFTKRLHADYSTVKNHSELRRNLYGNTKDRVMLSDVFKNQSQECGEIAALAQWYLQNEGIDSSYISGDVIWNKGVEFADKHSFILIRYEGKQIIYDPTNPTQTTASGLLPSIYIFDKNFENEINGNQKRFVRTTNILTNKEVLFGVNNNTNVSEKHIV